MLWNLKFDYTCWSQLATSTLACLVDVTGIFVVKKVVKLRGQCIAYTAYNRALVALSSPSKEKKHKHTLTTDSNN